MKTKRIKVVTESALILTLALVAVLALVLEPSIGPDAAVPGWRSRKRMVTISLDMMTAWKTVFSDSSEPLVPSEHGRVTSVPPGTGGD